VNFRKDFAAGLANVSEGHSKSDEGELGGNREKASTEMEERAEALGANVVVGAYIIMKCRELMVTASVTTAIVE